MRIIILGTGGVGTVIAQDLGEDPDISQIVLADADLAKAKRLEERIANAAAYLVDASKVDQLEPLLRGFHLVINALPPEFNQNVMRASLDNKANYLDMASGTIQGETIDESFQKQLNLDSDWKQGGLIALLHGGITPGITNIVAGEGADSLDRATRIIIRNFGKIEASESISVWSPVTALRDKASPPLTFRNGRFQRVKPFEGAEEYEFPNIGKETVVTYEHEEVSTLPRFIQGLEDVEFKMGGFDVTKYKVLFEAGLLSDEPLKIDRFEVSPLQVIAAMMPPTISPEELERKIEDGTIRRSLSIRLIEIEGEKGGKRTKLLYQISHPDLHQAFKRIWGANHLSYATGVSAAAFAKAILKGKIDRKGVFPPECLDHEARRFVFDEIRKYDLRVEQGIQ
ncbi:MAG: hypothetical protein GTO24_19070 [candidate division Zixibacteria bacterium]|nr:hypothetical protein [candidate division Zixibacteria bacterium]